MAAPRVIDVESLLAPITEEAPAGLDLRADSSPNSLYYRVKDARNAARAAERSAVEVGGPVSDEWDTVVETATETLARHSKDLEIAAWMIEGLVRREGFAGLRDGLDVVTGIVENFWEQCFPVADEEDGIEGKVAAISGLSGSGAVGTLIQPMRLAPLTAGSMASFSLWSYEQAIELEKVTENARRQERIANGAISMEQFQQSVAETPVAHFLELSQTIDEAIDALERMTAAFDAVAGVDAPATSGLRDMLQETRSALRHFAGDKLTAAEAVAAAEAGADEPDAVATTEAGGATVVVRKIGGYATRDEALAELTRIAEFFRKSEPHSPISYTLDDAVRRARMTLPDLLGELAEDPALIGRILLAAGIRSRDAGPEQ